MHDQQGVEALGLGPPDLGRVEGLAGERLALVVEAAVLVVPAPVEGVVDQAPGDLPGALVVGHAQGLGGLDEQVGGLDVVAERVVGRDRPPVAREVEVERPGLDGDLVADDPEDLAAAAP